MTIEQYALAFFQKHGMTADVAARVLEDIKTEAVLLPFVGKWNQPFQDLPDPAARAFHVALTFLGRNWIEKNEPDAFYKPMFM